MKGTCKHCGQPIGFGLEAPNAWIHSIREMDGDLLYGCKIHFKYREIMENYLTNEMDATPDDSYIIDQVLNKYQ